MIRKIRKPSMATTAFDPSLSPLQMRSKESQNGVVIEEIEGLIRFYKDGHVERPQIMPYVAPSVDPELGLTCRDIVVDRHTNVWARLYVPNAAIGKLPVLVYFHGGGFCVGSAAWSCYHEFLAKLASKSNLVVLSVNYRLAPENPLPAAYDDGTRALTWLGQQESVTSSGWWTNKCNFSNIYLSGDSAGANIAFHVALTRRNRPPEMNLQVQGLILIQPFFGGEARTHSERHSVQPPRSALTLAASDSYWRMSLPAGANRDHPWCNPTAWELGRRVRVMVCVAEMDILKDRNVEMCGRLVGKRNDGEMRAGVEQVVSKGVGHGFQILSKSVVAQTRTAELIQHIINFIKT